MESGGGTKGGGWRRRSFPASVFSEGGVGGRGRGGRVRGGGGDQQQQPILLRDATAAIDSLAAAAAAGAGEDDLAGEDISLLDNRPVDQKMLRKRNQGHKQKMNLDESNVQPSQLSLTANRLEASNDRQLHLPKLRTEEDEDDDDDVVTNHHQHSSLSSSSSTSSSSFNSFLFKSRPKPDVRENRINETESESESDTADASFQPYDVRAVSTRRDVITIVDETLTYDVIGGDRTRHADVTAMCAKEPELGNLIEFD